MRLSCLLLSLSIAPFGCADRSSGGGSGGGTGSSSDGGSESQTGGTSSGGDVCDDYANDPPVAGPPTVTIRNTGSEAIVLGSPTSCQPSLVAVESGVDSVPGVWYGPHCAFTCEEVMEGGCGCTADCPVATAVRIDPGASYTTTDWPGMFMVEAELPGECVNGDCGTSCNVLRQAPAGQHELTVGLVNAELCGDTACECMVNAEGWCELGGFFDLTTPYTASIDYVPGQDVVFAVP